LLIVEIQQKITFKSSAINVTTFLSLREKSHYFSQFEYTNLLNKHLERKGEKSHDLQNNARLQVGKSYDEVALLIFCVRTVKISIFEKRNINQYYMRSLQTS